MSFLKRVILICIPFNVTIYSQLLNYFTLIQVTHDEGPDMTKDDSASGCREIKLTISRLTQKRTRWVFCGAYSSTKANARRHFPPFFKRIHIRFFRLLSMPIPSSVKNG